MRYVPDSFKRRDSQGHFQKIFNKQLIETAWIELSTLSLKFNDKSLFSSQWCHHYLISNRLLYKGNQESWFKALRDQRTLVESLKTPEHQPVSLIVHWSVDCGGFTSNKVDMGAIVWGSVKILPMCVWSVSQLRGHWKKSIFNSWCFLRYGNQPKRQNLLLRISFELW